MDWSRSDELADELSSVGDLLRFCATLFEREEIFCGHGTDDRWDEAVALVVGHLRLPWDRADLVLDAKLMRDERRQLIELARKRVEARIPVPYLTGFAWFAGHRFEVDPRVVVPRSPIAELIEAHFQPWLGVLEPRRILDLCAGSGCIGIACAHAFPQAEVDLVDVSADALEVARKNVVRHGIADRVSLVKSDLLEAVPETRYELIVCNPPYVADSELDEMPPEYAHEPRLGLAGGDDGLQFALRVLCAARAYLHADGILVMEVGDAAAALERRCSSLPFLWPELEGGGRGLFVLRARDLPESAESL